MGVIYCCYNYSASLLNKAIPPAPIDKLDHDSSYAVSRKTNSFLICVLEQEYCVTVFVIPITAIKNNIITCIVGTKIRID